MTTSDAKQRFLERIEVISVPARADLLDALLVTGAATTTELGRMVPEAKSSMPWHMRRLEESGFVRRQDGSGTGRKAIWEPDDPRIEWSSDEVQDDEVTLAFQELERIVTDRRRRRLGEWALARWERPWAATPWSEAAIGRDYVLPAATADDLAWLDKEVVKLMGLFRTRVADRQPNDPDTEALFISLGAFPWRPGRRR